MNRTQIKKFSTVPLISNHFSINLPYKKITIWKVKSALSDKIATEEEIENFILQKAEFLRKQFKYYCKVGHDIVSFANRIENQISINEESNLILVKSDDYDIDTLLREQSEYAIMILNIIKKSILKNHGYSQLDEVNKYYKKRNSQYIQDLNICVINGLSISIDLYEDYKLKILIDSVVKIERKNNLLEAMRESNSPQYFDKFIKNRTFRALWGKAKKFVIHEISELTPLSPFPNKQYTTYADYYKRQYNIGNIDPNQKLLISYKETKQYDSVTKVTKKKTEKLLLIPQLLKLMWDSKSIKNWKNQEVLTDYLVKNPEKKLNEIKKAQDLFSNNEFDIKVDFKFNQVNARQYAYPKVLSNNKNAISEEGFINDTIKGKLKDWLVITQIADDADRFYEDLVTEASKLGFDLKVEPHWEIANRNAKANDFIEIIKYYKQKYKELQFVFLIVNDLTGSMVYKPIKKYLNEKTSLKSQFLIFNKGTNTKKGLKKNLLRQMANKIGFSSWNVVPSNCLSNKGTMLIGADVFHSKNSNSIASCISTTNDDFSETFSTFRIQEKEGTEIMSNRIADMVLECVNAYKLKRKCLPKQIIFYRDGVGDGMISLVKEKEIHSIKTLLIRSFREKTPLLNFILVTKRISDRFFNQGKNNTISNPNGGTIISKGAILNTGNEFFMIAQKVTKGTATPTRYQILLNESNLIEDDIHEITYSQCFNYSNWNGAIKVPSVCQYAHKMAYLIGITKMEEVNESHRYNKFYL